MLRCFGMKAMILGSVDLLEGLKRGEDQIKHALFGWNGDTDYDLPQLYVGPSRNSGPCMGRKTPITGGTSPYEAAGPNRVQGQEYLYVGKPRSPHYVCTWTLCIRAGVAKPYK